MLSGECLEGGRSLLLMCLLRVVHDLLGCSECSLWSSVLQAIWFLQGTLSQLYLEEWNILKTDWRRAASLTLPDALSLYVLQLLVRRTRGAQRR